MNEATLENEDTRSLLVVDPTLIADEIQAGALIWVRELSFPAATTVATPRERRLSMTGLYGSLSHGAEKRSLPRLRFTAAMLYWLLSVFTRSSPAMMSESQASAHRPPQPQKWMSSNSENTCTARILAPGATPENVCPFSVPFFPAAMPATWVPWSHSSRLHGTAAPTPNCCTPPLGQTVVLLWVLLEKHASSMTLFARNGCVLSTPVSTIATTVPVPSQPDAHDSGPPIRGTLCASIGARTRSSTIRCTNRLDASSSASASGPISSARNGMVWYDLPGRCPVPFRRDST